MQKGEELDGQLAPSEDEEQKLMRSVIEDDNAGKDGNLIEEATNQSLGSFIPDLMFSQIVNNYQQAENMYGDKIIREITSYDSEYVEKNAKVPEFQRELKSKIGERIKRLKSKGLINADGSISDKGHRLAALVMYTEELDNLEAKGLLGEKNHKDKSHYGERKDSDLYKKGDRYVDIDLMKTVKLSARRGHNKIIPQDLKIFQRDSKGNIEIIYAIDASGSMKGRKIEVCKKAGVALAYKAIQNKDKVGIIVFGSEIRDKVAPTDDFITILRTLGKISASKETNFEVTVTESLEMFSKDKSVTKHLIFITDGMPTTGDDPHKEALDNIAKAKHAGITCSMIGIQTNEDTSEFMLEGSILGGGKFYNVKNLDELDAIILEDYERS
jgi:Mg-chelatase subunit ChlD